MLRLSSGQEVSFRYVLKFKFKVKPDSKQTQQKKAVWFFPDAQVQVPRRQRI